MLIEPTPRYLEFEVSDRLVGGVAFKQKALLDFEKGLQIMPTREGSLVVFMKLLVVAHLRNADGSFGPEEPAIAAYGVTLQANDQCAVNIATGDLRLVQMGENWPQCLRDDQTATWKLQGQIFRDRLLDEAVNINETCQQFVQQADLDPRFNYFKRVLRPQ